MKFSSELINLAHYLAGEFSNPEQAMAEPVWYVRLNLWQRPLPLALFGELAFFAEQANSLYLHKAYRQRVMKLSDTEQGIRVDYYAFQHPEAFIGAGANPDRLAQISAQDLAALPGCSLAVKVAGSGEQQIFTANLLPESRCYFQYQQETKEVILGFEASATEFKSYDRGVDPQTQAPIWGAIAGPYRFHKIQDFSKELLIEVRDHKI